MRNALLLGALFCAASAQAQYKYVEQGVTTYSDRPPATGDVRRLHPLAKGGAGANLPFALRAAMQKYPVTLYSAPDCAPCAEVRSHLMKRGVPFEEKLVKSTGDDKAFKALGFTEPNFPALTVGGQRQTGYESGELNRLLDSAGYPKQSVLPTTYQQPTASQLTKEEAPVRLAADKTERIIVTKPVSQTAAPATPTPPAGAIRF